MNRGDPIHGERIVDGDSSALTVLSLFNAGSVTARTLDADEFLVITDLTIYLESGGDFALVADSAAAGRYIAIGNAAANGGLDRTYHVPYACSKGVTPKFQGAGTNRSSCIISGYIHR